MDTINNSSMDYEYKNSLKSNNKFFLNKIIRVEKYFNRPLASLIVRAVFKTAITPNQLTYFSFFLGLLAAYFFTKGNYLYFALGGVLAQLSSLVDCADGQLARAKNMCSSFGAYLDIFFDRIIDFCLLAGISIGLYHWGGNLNMLITGLLTANLYLLQITLYYHTKKLLKNDKTGETSEARSLFLLMMCGAGVAGWLDIFMYLMLAETVILNIFRVWYFLRLYRKQLPETA